ncbi:MAG: hypothetical protein WC657_06015 [Candidatus Paceibacterota bacterium]|jgi:hypothetical protein
MRQFQNQRNGSDKPRHSHPKRTLFGNHSSANTAGFNYFLSEDRLEQEGEALMAFAAKYFPGGNPAMVSAAWGKFTSAMEIYPFCVPFLYTSPVNYALALTPEPVPLSGNKVGRSWLMDEWGDDLRDSITEDWPLDEIITRISQKWQICFPCVYHSFCKFALHPILLLTSLAGAIQPSRFKREKDIHFNCACNQVHLP